jgi:two-component system, NtrC family, response regulator AlgB
MESPPTVLVVDDEPHILKTLRLAFEALGFAVTAHGRPHEALEDVAPGRFDLAFVDLMMQPLDGMTVLRELLRKAPETTVVMITAHGSVETAVEAMKEGAYYYLQKPFDLAELRAFATRALDHHRLRQEVRRLRARLADARQADYGPIVTQDAALREVLDLAVGVADATISVLLEGESGTGKEGVATLIHDRSDRAARPFVRVNCAALPENLLESELFGHVRGAFTGAVKDRQGRFEAADGGTILLDEIGEMPPGVQAKLLRVLQSGEFERVGETRTRRVDVRVVAATNRDLEAAMRERTFREDLFYRVAGVRLRLPPLRERPGDVPLLVQHFVERFSKGAAVEVSPEALRALRAYRWPGNVRELINVVERAVVLARGGRVQLPHLPVEVREAEGNAPELLSLEEVEKRHILQVLAHARDYDEAARILGIDPTTLWRKRKRYGL